jgi:hypothetical protein
VSRVEQVHAARASVYLPGGAVRVWEACDLVECLDGASWKICKEGDVVAIAPAPWTFVEVR